MFEVFDLPTLIVVAFAAGVMLILWGVRTPQPRPSPNRPRSPHWTPRLHTGPTPRRRPDAPEQLRWVERCEYTQQPLLRFQESKVFDVFDTKISYRRLPWRIFAQVSLGEILQCDVTEGFNAVNAKRVDMLIVDESFNPLAAVEYQGDGHHLSPAAARDAVKKEALRKAGIAYFEVTSDDGPRDVDRIIDRLIDLLKRPGRPPPAPPPPPSDRMPAAPPTGFGRRPTPD